MNNKQQRGFTLVEITAVMVIVTVLAAYAIPRMAGPGEFAARTNADRLLAALQYAHTLAQRQGIATSLVLSSATFSVQQYGAYVKLATENNAAGNYIVDVHPEVTITSSCGTTVFNADGGAAACTYSIKEGGVTHFTILVETSGFVHFGS